MAEVGHRRSPNEMPRVSIAFDEDTLSQVQQRANRAGHSFGEEVRILVEMGLETMELVDAS
jgi:hypothetical protein